MTKKESVRKQKNESRKTDGGQVRSNKEFVVITYLFLAVFVCMMGYFTYFQMFLSEDFINNPYNTRQDTFEKRVIRGEIRSEDGYTLAETKSDEDGQEYRYYPYGEMFAHAVGYASNGKAGIESMANFNLLRSHTFYPERLLNELKGEKNEGDHVVTTLNFKLQQTAYEALGSRNGAVVVIEPSTGKIRAMVSKPDFNPNRVEEEWEELTAEDSDSSVLLNRATQGLYPPGSVFKLFTTLEYIHENPGYDNYQFDCGGSFTSDGAVIHCYQNKKHGEETLQDSFAESCNASYSSIGLSLDPDQFAELCDSLLFNKDLPTRYESSKSVFSLKEGAGASEIMETAIGQGKTLVTPLHMALVTCAVANDGILMAPYVVDHTENRDGAVVKKYSPSEYGVLFQKEDTQVLSDYMEAVVAYGTGKELSGQSYSAAGKTGSAEFSVSGEPAHSWFIGYAQGEGKETIAIAVVVEASGTGSKYAVPIAKNIFDVYFLE